VAGALDLHRRDGRGVGAVEAEGDRAAGVRVVARIGDGGRVDVRTELEPAVARPAAVDGFADDAAARVDAAGLVERDGGDRSDRRPLGGDDRERVEVPAAATEAEEEVMDTAEVWEGGRRLRVPVAVTAGGLAGAPGAA